MEFSVYAWFVPELMDTTGVDVPVVRSNSNKMPFSMFQRDLIIPSTSTDSTETKRSPNTGLVVRM